MHGKQLVYTSENQNSHIYIPHCWIMTKRQHKYLIHPYSCRNPKLMPWL